MHRLQIDTLSGCTLDPATSQHTFYVDGTKNTMAINVALVGTTDELPQSIAIYFRLRSIDNNMDQTEHLHAAQAFLVLGVPSYTATFTFLISQPADTAFVLEAHPEPSHAHIIQAAESHPIYVRKKLHISAENEMMMRTIGDDIRTRHFLPLAKMVGERLQRSDQVAVACENKVLQLEERFEKQLAKCREENAKIRAHLAAQEKQNKVLQKKLGTIQMLMVNIEKMVLKTAQQ